MAKKKESLPTFEVDGKTYEFVYQQFSAKVEGYGVKKYDAEQLLNPGDKEAEAESSAVLSHLVSVKSSVITEKGGSK